MHVPVLRSTLARFRYSVSAFSLRFVRLPLPPYAFEYRNIPRPAAARRRLRQPADMGSAIADARPSDFMTGQDRLETEDGIGNCHWAGATLYPHAAAAHPQSATHLERSRFLGVGHISHMSMITSRYVATVASYPDSTVATVAGHPVPGQRTVLPDRTRSGPGVLQT